MDELEGNYKFISWQTSLEELSKDVLLTAGNSVIPDLNLLALGAALLSLGILCYVLISLWLEVRSLVPEQNSLGVVLGI